MLLARHCGSMQRACQLLHVVPFTTHVPLHSSLAHVCDMKLSIPVLPVLP